MYSICIKQNLYGEGIVALKKDANQTKINKQKLLI